MSEMDDTISVYLTEMKDENDRLIKELQNVSPSELAATSVQQTVSYEPQQEQAYSAAEQELKKDRPLSLDKDARLYVPKKYCSQCLFPSETDN
ncbi:hypothetical protein OL548_12740 [Lysinibacillus sp. MHQ-1]|nr:hypothetical protein OL548_12740 [Lysinibacillus sp. MHQ-1]